MKSYMFKELANQHLTLRQTLKIPAAKSDMKKGKIRIYEHESIDVSHVLGVYVCDFAWPKELLTLQTERQWVGQTIWQ